MLVFIFLSLISMITLVGCFMYIIIMGPSRYHRDGVIGKLYRLVTNGPVYVCGFCVSCCFGCDQRKGRACCSRFGKHATQERNWFMVIFYIVLVWTVEFFYLLVALPRLEASLLSKSVSWGLVLLSEYLWVRAVVCDPGTVTTKEQRELQRQQHADKSAKRLKRMPRPARHRGGGGGGGGSAQDASAKPQREPHFPFSPAAEYILNHRYIVDGMVFAQAADEVTAHLTQAQKDYRSPTNGSPVGLGQECSTCHVPRPSRGKHCRLCHRCVRRFDHHCPWINNDVAEGTMRYFLGFLFWHAISCTWACLDLFRNIRQFLIAHHAWGWVLRHPGGRSIPLDLSTYLVIVINYHMLEACLLFFAFFIGLVLYGFWAYQMTFAMANLTVNDMNKMDDTADFVATLPTLDLVYREAAKVRAELDAVAERKPTALRKLQEPPLPKTAPGFEEGGKKNAKYRAQVKKMLIHDLRGLYDRGAWNNLMEVMFPYSDAYKPEILEKAAACVK
ncbi:putative Zinc finger DHHC domain containing transmembrane protein [Leptomonas pyrrhocoris]|uniref:Palmitoyltransferase n=1 Tax=Leptomonas pyrrhocoris TaxID=157538 RepID=A0A0N0DTJ1_LEPPY|nr:putative Zinc finger DHHC domain containing transmembrane protein [Leptomonas pyrrhocoris]KPA77562.1 putative Zinc finger DHHC domain containing transmembrane protein [Leptomonas pyrrhocoris]|eukprot:XP_015656001.1 putative Zinc finger DHHC domain containing transmembrane protein [Leptomonas pyrrhocoris]